MMLSSYLQGCQATEILTWVFIILHLLENVSGWALEDQPLQTSVGVVNMDAEVI